jgi:lauroyl/myristoyl acyltransferase
LKAHPGKIYRFSILVMAAREQPITEPHMRVAAAATKLVLKLKLAVAWAIFCFLRWCERLVPTSSLSLLLWPPAALYDLVHVRQRTPLNCWSRFPESWRAKRWRFVLRQSLVLYHSQLLYLWPDRLRTTRWLSRCRLEGESDLIGSREGDRGVVLASVHFGPSEILPYLLRAHGIVTTLIGASPVPDSLESLTSHQYALSAPADVPVFLSASEMSPLPRFAHIRQVLGPGRRLLVMVDVDRGVQFQIPFENRLFRMATGAIRLAAMAGAELIPCLITETASWKFVIHFGPPVPRHYLDNSPDMLAVGAHLLGEFSKIITRYPEQCNSTLLSALSPLPVN